MQVVDVAAFLPILFAGRDSVLRAYPVTGRVTAESGTGIRLGSSETRRVRRSRYAWAYLVIKWSVTGGNFIPRGIPIRIVNVKLFRLDAQALDMRKNPPLRRRLYSEMIISESRKPDCPNFKNNRPPKSILLKKAKHHLLPGQKRDQTFKQV